MQGLTTKPAHHRSKIRKLLFLVAGLAFILVLVFAVAPAILAYVTKVAVTQRVAEVARKLGREVEIGRVSSGLFQALTLERLRVWSSDKKYEVLAVERAQMDFSLWDAIWNRGAPAQIQFAGLRINAFLDHGLPVELADIFRKLRASDEAGTTPHHADCRMPSFRGDGQIRFLSTGFTEPLATLEIAEVMVDCEDNVLAAHLLAVARGLGAAPARIRVDAKGRSLQEFSLVIRSSVPLEPTGLWSGRALVAMRGNAIYVESSPLQTTVRIEGLEIPEVVPLKGFQVLERWFTHAGPLNTAEARLVFSGPAPQLFQKGFFDLLRTAVIRDGSGHLVPASSKVSGLRFRGLNVAFNRDPSDSVSLRIEGEVSAGRLGFSRIDMNLGFDTKLEPTEARLSLSGPIFVEIASAVHPRLLAWPGATANVSLFARRDGGRWGLAGQIGASNIVYFWTKICLVPISNLSFDAAVKGEYDHDGASFYIKLNPLRVNQAHFLVEVRGFDINKKPRFEFTLNIPKQDCDAVFRAIPRVMIPRLEGAKLQGQMALEARFVADLGRPERSSLTVTPDVEGCNALTLGPLIDVERLNSDSFVFEIHEKDYKEPIRVGPGTDSYVPIEEIPFVVQQAALATEDMAFFRHQGFRIGLINRAIKLNLSEGWYVYGGSTISQQLVKNLFLSREKTLARKLEEAIIVWHMEKRVPKERILELYLNCIEFGRHVYGIKAAAKTYFNKEVRDLTATEAAFIMATKPAPRYAHKVYESRSFNEWWVKRIKGILERLWREMGVIDERTAKTPDPCPPQGPPGKYLVPCFYYPEDNLYTQPSVAPDTEVPPGMPENLPGGEATQAR